MARSLVTILAAAGTGADRVGVCASWIAAQQITKVPGENEAVGKQIFATTCAACHGLDGGGGERGPDISRRREVQRLPDKALLQIVREGVPATGMPAFGSLGAARIQAVVRYLRSLQGQTGAATVSGDAKRGRDFFFGPSGCSQCHMVKGEGGFIGADLSSYANTRSADEHPNGYYRSQPEPGPSKTSLDSHHDRRTDPDRRCTE